jgi:hypothetical protein
MINILRGMLMLPTPATINIVQIRQFQERAAERDDMG